MSHLKKNLLAYTLIPLLILAISASYFRFMVLYNYEVVHEGFCDPYTESCHEYCEDDLCTDPFYYSWIHRQASSLRELCGGESVLDCVEAGECSAEEQNCYVSFCDPQVSEDCELLSENDYEQSVTEPYE